MRRPEGAFVLVKFALFFLSAQLLVGQTIPSPEYAIIELPGGLDTSAQAVNDNGEAVGQVCLDTSQNSCSACRWDSSHSLQIMGGSNSIATSINVHGDACGSQAVFGKPESTPMLWDRFGNQTLLPTLPGFQYYHPYGINSSGEIVGGMATPDANNVLHGHGFLISGGVMYDLTFDNIPPAPNGFVSDARAINDSGAIVGTLPDGAFFWDRISPPFLLGDLGVSGSVAYALNNKGFSAGYAPGPLEQPNLEHLPLAVFFAAGGGATNLGTLSSAPSLAWSYALSINAWNQVVGTSETDTAVFHAFIWDSDHKMRDLNTLIPQDSGWVLRSATGINNKGVIVGYGYLQDPNREHVKAFMLVPPTVEVTLDPPSDGSTIYRIGPEPSMPMITAHAKVIGVTPDPTFLTTFNWFVEVHYDAKADTLPPNQVYAPAKSFNYVWPDLGSGTEWTTKQGTSFSTQFLSQSPYRNIIRGGSLTVSVRGLLPDGTQAFGQATGYQILGNPVGSTGDAETRGRLRSVLTNLTLRKVASHESSQPPAIPDGGHQFDQNGYPLWSHDNFYGVGVMQLTNPPPTDDDVWNWLDNTLDGKSRFAEKVGVVRRLHDRVETNVTTYVNSVRAREALPPIRVIVPQLTRDAGTFDQE
jgi:probable HAF family extracellular repeat protein